MSIEEKKNKIINHYLPRFQIRKWKEENAKLYDKTEQRSREILYEDFSEKNYYSINGTDDLETRLGFFENYISQQIRKIDDSNIEVKLTGKELFFLKLYCSLCALRQEFTSEVILGDESGFYKSNNYLWGIPKLSKKVDVLFFTDKIVSAFERIKDDKSFFHCENFDDGLILPEMIIKAGGVETANWGMHLCILRSKFNDFCISNSCAIIENTMDGDHLYTYIPVSPKTALLLVKTKYYRDKEQYDYSRQRLAAKYYAAPDEYLSVVFGTCADKNYDSLLFCSYYKPLIISATHVNPTIIKNNDYSENILAIKEVPWLITSSFNSIFYQDGNKFIYINETQLKIVQNVPTPYRQIILG